MDSGLIFRLKHRPPSWGGKAWYLCMVGFSIYFPVKSTVNQAEIAPFEVKGEYIQYHNTRVYSECMITRVLRVNTQTRGPEGPGEGKIFSLPPLLAGGYNNNVNTEK